jgi:hypothetical protein
MSLIRGIAVLIGIVGPPAYDASGACAGALALAFGPVGYACLKGPAAAPSPRGSLRWGLRRRRVALGYGVFASIAFALPSRLQPLI